MQGCDVFMRKIRAAEPANSGDTSGFKSLLKRAITEMLVLLTLQHKPMYAYEIMSELEEMSDGYLSYNTLYISIYRLEELKFIVESAKTVSESNRTRVYYSITDAGNEYLDNLIDEYRQFSGIVDGIIDHWKNWKVS